MLTKARNSMTFGERLAYTRKEKGLTRKQLAELIGVKPNTVSCWVMGRQPGVSIIQKIIKALDVSEDWFENDDNFKNPNFKPVKKVTNFGYRLAYTRKRKGLMQKQLAELIGVKPCIVSSWETDVIYPSVSMMQKIIRALDVSEDWLENDINFKGQDMKPVKKLTNFGHRLAYTRKKKGLMQKQLAELIGVKPCTVSGWENSVHIPNSSMIRKITKALEIEDDWFENDNNFQTKNFTDHQVGRKLTKEQQQLVIDSEYIIYCVMKKYNLTPYKDEFWDIGEIGLCKAALQWDEKRGVPFFTLAFNYIKWEFNTEGRKEMKDLYPKMSLDQPVGNDNSDAAGETFGSLVPDPDDEFERIEYKILVESVYQKVEHALSPKEKVAFKRWLYGENYTNIAREMGGISSRTISDHIVNARNKCKTFFNPDELFT